MPNDENKPTKTPAELIAEMRAEIDAMKATHAEELKQRDAVIAELSRTPAASTPSPVENADRAAKIAENLNKRR